LQAAFHTRDFISQSQSLFFQTAHHQLIDWGINGGLVNQGVKVTVLYP
jgi:hypothetical protein